MTFEEYFTIITAKRPIPKGGKITMTAEQFKKILHQTWLKGRSQQSEFERIFGK